MRWFWVLILLLAGSLRVVQANDSMAEIAVGGLALTETDAISLDSEDLYISKTEVRVAYRFTNTTDKDIETLVAFPLPDQNFNEEQGDGYLRDYKTELDFRTEVDGKPVQYEIVEQAFKGGVDITARLKELGLSVLGLQDFDPFQAQIAKLSPGDRDALIKDGLLVDQGVDGNPAYVSQWDLRTTITRKQVFPAGKTIGVSHRYMPLAGGSVGGSLMPDARNDEWGQYNKTRYCIEDGWYGAFDKAIAPKVTEENPVPYSEVWLGYVLKSGANWKGPIKDFRMVIDKGKAENLVSFCAEGVKKISDTQFEVRKKDFEPKEDVNVLIVEWWDEAQ
jgi:hypothetical protein